MEKIAPENLVPMDLFTQDVPITIELAYAKDCAPNIFGQLYHEDARLWLHRDLAKIVLQAATIIHQQTGLHLRLYDGLRTVEAQDLMGKSEIVQKNPQWLEEPRLVSKPGTGGHPRGMAVDLTLQTANGDLPDMGTAFDFLAEDASAAHNPAHRDYPHLSDEVRKNRKILTDAMVQAADMLGTPLLPLPQEWWDFRIPSDISEGYEPLSDAELPPQMRMINSSVTTSVEDFPPSHFEALKAEIISKLKN